MSEQLQDRSREIDETASRAVSLNDLSVRKFAEGVRRVFFPVWPQGLEWRFRLDESQPWAFACDFDKKLITAAQRAHVDKDSLRAALIAQVAHARSGPDSAEAWYAELDRTRTVATILGKDRLADYLDLLMQRADMNVLDARLSANGQRIETWRPVADPAEVMRKAVRADTDDTLEVTVMERQFAQASAAIKRLGLK